jgi:hypothetical protein
MDERLLSVLQDCEDLYQRRCKACSALEQGFFLTACAQKQLGANAFRERNVREDIEPAVRVVMCVQWVLLGCGLGGGAVSRLRCCGKRCGGRILTCV